MGTLTAALSWAERGFPVFPLRENEKEPAIDDWVNVATTDPATIRALWTDPVLRHERNYNIGVKCNDFVVVDIDVKAGKDGCTEYAQLQGHYDTLVVQTPSGGYHCYFRGPDSSNAPISKSIDIRSHNGYVVAPGSVINGVPYHIINNREMALVPSLISNLLQAPLVRAEADADLTLDTPAAIEAGRRFLESAAPAIEGQRGDETTFITAARLVREMALSVPAAFVLMRDHWNDKCVPPWPLDQLYAKVENASQYGTAEFGKLSFDLTFGHLNIPEPPTVFEQMETTWGNAILPDRIPHRPWLVERMLMEGAVTLLLAAGSAGKSSVSLALAAHLSQGLDFAGYKAKRPCKTIVYNGEDDLHEQSRRLLAVCMAYNFDYNAVKKNIMLLSPRELKMDLVTSDGRRPVRNDTLVQHIIKEASADDVGLLILDPLVKIHKCDESDNVQMDYVMETLTNIAAEARVAVMALHHTTKTNGRTEEKQGNMDVSRGASAIVNAARIAFTMFNASAQDAEDYGLNDDERYMWVRLDDAKMNLALATDKATWFRKEGLKIPSQDVVGVLKHEVLEKSHTHITSRVAETLISTMSANGVAAMGMPQAIAILKTSVPLWANKTDIEIRRRIEGMFTVAFTVQGKTLRIVREASDDKKAEKISIVLS